ncbi:rhs core protein [Escherichia coli]|nr:rhs core protein [Escherichia coli]
MQELYIEKELFIKRTTENHCRALVLRGTLEYLFDEIIAGEWSLALLQKEIKKD